MVLNRRSVITAPDLQFCPLLGRCAQWNSTGGLTYRSDRGLLSISRGGVSDVGAEEDHRLLEHQGPADGDNAAVTPLQRRPNKTQQNPTSSLVRLTCPAGGGCCWRRLASHWSSGRGWTGSEGWSSVHSSPGRTVWPSPGPCPPHASPRLGGGGEAKVLPTTAAEARTVPDGLEAGPEATRAV